MMFGQHLVMKKLEKQIQSYHLMQWLMYKDLTLLLHLEKKISEYVNLRLTLTLVIYSAIRLNEIK